MGKHDRTQHDVFAQLVGLGLDHHDSVGASRDNQIQSAFLDLVLGRVQHIVTVDIADTSATDGAHERDT